MGEFEQDSSAPKKGYRSRYEQLITFSNKNFYDSDLVTFPSSKVDAPGIGVDYYHVDGVFDRKVHTNRKEAEFIVDLIYQNIEKYPNRSLVWLRSA